MPNSAIINHTPLTHIQALYFELIRTIRYNLLDGERVVEQLLEWRNLWESVIADRQPMPRVERSADNQYNVYPPLGKQAVETAGIRIMVFDPITEEIIQWIP